MRVSSLTAWFVGAAILAAAAHPATSAWASASNRIGPSSAVPASARQLIVVSSPTTTPAGFLATFEAFSRSGGGAAWHRVFGPWQAETGSGHLIAAGQRHEGDHATPIGIFSIGTTLYGNEPNPGGLHSAYHHLVCGDWWDEDPFSAQYSRFVHVPCGSAPPFAAWSEALWTETVAYPYFAVIDFNTDPVVAGVAAPGSGIFLHSWMDAPTEGCVALHEPDLLDVLRWLAPSLHPVIEIATAVSPAAALR